MCPRGLHCACFKVGRQRAIWPEANNLWWEYYDKMVAAWPWLIEDKRYKSLCITNNADCNWSPGAKLHVNRFKPKAASLAFLHIPRNGGGSIEYAASKKHIRWGICNYWQKDGVCSKDNPPVYTKVTNPFMYQWYHVPIQWIPEEVPTYYKGHDLFAVVRNPYDRMVSEFNWQCHSMRYCEENEESIIGNATFLNEWLDAQLTKFRECPKVEKLDPAHPDQPCVMMWSGHFIRQSDFIFDGPTMDKPMVDYVLHFETLAEEFVSLMKDYSMNLTLTPYNLHRTDKGLTVQDLNKTTIDLINEVYLRDFKLWGYRMM